jgi:hypothetical protein
MELRKRVGTSGRATGEQELMAKGKNRGIGRSRKRKHVKGGRRGRRERSMEEEEGERRRNRVPG